MFNDSRMSGIGLDSGAYIVLYLDSALTYLFGYRTIFSDIIPLIYQDLCHSDLLPFYCIPIRIYVTPKICSLGL